MANLIAALFGGTKKEKDIKRLTPIVEKVKAEYEWARSLKDNDFPLITSRWKEEVKNKEKTLDSLLPKAYALVREAAGRTLSEWLYDVQIMGAIVLHEGSILEMKTGEGKTLTSVAPAYLNALEGKGVHIVTVNDYLASRDAEWMGRVYSFLGLTVGKIISGEDQERKKDAYSKDITYGTNNEFGFDYLRDNMKTSIKAKTQRSHHFAIIDEIDSILIDEARTPLIISGRSADDTPLVRKARAAVPFLKECEKDPETGNYYEISAVDKLDRALYQAFDEKGDYKLDEKSKKVTFTKQGMENMEKILLRNNALTPSQDGSLSLYSDENFLLVHYVTQAVRAQCLYNKDTDYIVKDGIVQIVDEFTGRILPGRRYSEGLHQAIEAKEGVKIKGQSKTFASITFQNFFRMYDKISGMTGTADTEALEFREIYSLDTVVIPTNLPVIREDLADLTYYNEDFKFKAILEDVKKIHATGQPILIGTTSIEKSEKLSRLLLKEGIKHEVLNAKNHEREAFIIGGAGAKGSVTIATNMAGRGTDIKLGGSLLHLALKKVGSNASDEELRKTMEDLSEEYKKAYEEVKALGGLYIIGSERHESRRIDNQLRGRSGRQGDPGKSRFYISLEDPLMRLFAKDNMKQMIGRLGLKDGEAIHHKFLDSAIENAQKRVEERNFEIRKHLLEYDNVLNEQRNFIYTERDKILSSDNLLSLILSILYDKIEEEWEESEGNEDIFAANIKSLYPSLSSFKKEDVKNEIEKNLYEKEEQVTKEAFNEFLRFVYLRAIDKEWVDHLDVLENLKDSSSLMSYAQKNPLVEYKSTASDAFSALISEVNSQVLKIALNVKITTERKERRENIQLHENRGETAVSSESTARSTTVVRKDNKVGRNEPCPCGSGRKYKNCCGRNTG